MLLALKFMKYLPGFVVSGWRLKKNNKDVKFAALVSYQNKPLKRVLMKLGAK